MSFQVYDERELFNGGVQWTDSTTPGVQNVLATGPYGARCDVLSAVNNDIIDHVILISIDGFSPILDIGAVNVPAGSGYGGVPSVDVLSALGPQFATGINLGSGNNLRVEFVDTLLSPRTFGVFAQGGLF